MIQSNIFDYFVQNKYLEADDGFETINLEREINAPGFLEDEDLESHKTKELEREVRILIEQAQRLNVYLKEDPTNYDLTNHRYIVKDDDDFQQKVIYKQRQKSQDSENLKPGFINKDDDAPDVPDTIELKLESRNKRSVKRTNKSWKPNLKTSN